MKRYEFSEGSSNKFWEIELEDSSFTTRYGKLGSEGQTATKSFGSAAEAKKQYLKIIAEKEKKGYELVSGDEDEEDEDDDGEGVKDAFPSNPDLEAAIYRDPDSDDGYLVYADWLTSKGDPQGELITLAIAARKKPALQSDVVRLQGLMPINQLESQVSTWDRGFVDTLRIGSDDEWADEIERTLDAELTDALKLRGTRFMRELTIGVYNDDDGQLNYGEVVRVLAKEKLPPTLTSLTFSCFGFQISWTDLGETVPWKKLASLESFSVKMGAFDLGAIDAPNLTSFEVITGGFSKSNLKSVTSAKWPKLQKLTLYFGLDDYGCDVEASDLKPIYDGKGLGALTHLGLCNAQFSDEIANGLASSKILKQIKTLDLSKGVLGDVGGQALLDNADAFAHLESIDLSDSYLSDDMQQKLSAKFKNVTIGTQQEPDGDGEEQYRYVQVGE